MKKLIFLIPIFLFVTACSKHQSPKPAPAPKPAAALLSQPAQNAACTTGTPAGTGESTVAFSWNTANNADTYEIVITNLNTNITSTQTANTTSASVTLQEATPFSWYIISRSNATADTTHSATWKFYNAGPGQTNFAPFPAALLAPSFGQSITAGSINLSWSGDAIQNNISSYDVNFGTTSPPVLYKSNVNSPLSIRVSAGITYYWQIITHDNNGNRSSSQVWQFSAN
jgi:hypothetical protein